MSFNLLFYTVASLLPLISQPDQAWSHAKNGRRCPQCWQG